MVESAWPPRRNRLTVSNGQGRPALRKGLNAQDKTWLAILPLESHCYAVRLGLANPFREPMAILAASIHPSDSYNPVTGAEVPGTSTGVPTGGAAGTTVFFDAQGGDSFGINTAGQVRGLLLPGDPDNIDDSSRAFTIAWSDWVPVRSIQRADGGTNPLLFTYLALAGGSVSTVGFGANPFSYAMSSACRGRVVVSLTAAKDGDFTQDTTATTWQGNVPAPKGNGSQWAMSPLFCLQYRSMTPGFQGIISGDSLMCGPGGPTGDGFSAAPIRAAYDLSTLSDPVCIAHLGCGGVRSSIYHDALLRNIGAIGPSFLVLQPLSRNDGMTPSSLQLLLEKLQGTCALAKERYGAVTIFQGAYPMPSVDPSVTGDTSQVTLWSNVRSMLKEMAASGLPSYDGASLIGDADAPWRYRPGYSDDETHPNDAATVALTPAVRVLLRRLLFGQIAHSA